MTAYLSSDSSLDALEGLKASLILFCNAELIAFEPNLSSYCDFDNRIFFEYFSPTLSHEKWLRAQTYELIKLSNAFDIF